MFAQLAMKMLPANDGKKQLFSCRFSKCKLVMLVKLIPALPLHWITEAFTPVMEILLTVDKLNDDVR